MPSSKGEHIMDSILIYQAANDLVQNTGTRNIKRIARSCSLDILETPRFKDVLGFLSLHFDKPLILINSHLDSQTKQMVCGYALGHYLEHQILMDLHTLNKSLAHTRTGQPSQKALYRSFFGTVRRRKPTPERSPKHI